MVQTLSLLWGGRHLPSSCTSPGGTINHDPSREPLFSVVIPTYNRAELVRHAIQSVLAQSLADVEVVVSDNCSTDGTPDVVGGFSDARVRYVRTESHVTIPDSWEFGRSHARGRLVLMLSDDDALTSRALEILGQRHAEYGADFLFCTPAEYRDSSWTDDTRNTLMWPAFSGVSSPVQPATFIESLFSFKPRFNMHPSAFVFSRDIAAKVVAERGRFFKTTGVEYYAWPIAAAAAAAMVHVDAPLIVVGRTAKSWGTNMVLRNPGAAMIEKFASDVKRDKGLAPLTNLTFANLMMEGMLTAKADFPDLLGRYSVDEVGYLRRTQRDLQDRARQGVDVTAETQALRAYVAERPALSVALRPSLRARGAAALPLRKLLGQRKSGLPAPWAVGIATGDAEGFDDVIEAARWLERSVTPTGVVRDTESRSA
jgi:glycosyltransferase involved in cell wall biosynthesis